MRNLRVSWFDHCEIYCLGEFFHYVTTESLLHLKLEKMFAKMLKNVHLNNLNKKRDIFVQNIAEI